MVTVPQEREADVVLVGRNFDPAWVVRPVVVCHDGSARARAILPGARSYADELSRPLIAVGQHGHTEDTRRRLGGVAGAVIHGAPCPVLIARQPDLIRTRP
jgi:nucleotide-binding universal stress UspA family protein